MRAPTEQSGLERLRNVRTLRDVAALFGMSYKNLSRVIYDKEERYRYRSFELPKKTGGTRSVSAPNKRIKAIQRRLAAILQQAYVARPSAQGFLPDRSIVTNAREHLEKTFVLNVDLHDFFGTLHFGRIRNLFMRPPFEIPREPAIVLAHICCFQGRLPQGAPTSPIITNLICRKLDGQFQQLSKRNRATYTRYVDDITFSFSCKEARLPPAIVSRTPEGIVTGAAFTEILTANGFTLNPAKTRLHGRTQRMEVTGLVVNDFVNVRRPFIRRIHSMLYAWETHGLDKAAEELFAKYAHTLSGGGIDKTRTFREIVKGRLAYVHMVRGRRDPIYVKLAKRFNALANGETDPLPIIETTSTSDALLDTVFVVESLYDGADGVHASQGTGFFLKGVGFVTAAHVVQADGDKIHDEIVAFSHKDTSNRFKLTIQKIDTRRDLAIGTVIGSDGRPYEPKLVFSAAKEQAKVRDHITLVGYPAYKMGQTPYTVEAKVASRYGQVGVQKFEIATQIREGNSGGPVINDSFEVVGIALEGAEKTGGNNAAVLVEEVYKVDQAV